MSENIAAASNNVRLVASGNVHKRPIAGVLTLKDSTYSLASAVRADLTSKALKAIKAVKLKTRYGEEWTKWFKADHCVELDVFETLIGMVGTRFVQAIGCPHAVLCSLPLQPQSQWGGKMWVQRGSKAPARSAHYTIAKMTLYEIKWECRRVMMRIRVRRLGGAGETPCACVGHTSNNGVNPSKRRRI